MQFTCSALVALISGLDKKWASRIFTVLGVRMDESDGLSPHVCRMCTCCLESLEKAASRSKRSRIWQ